MLGDVLQDDREGRQCHFRHHLEGNAHAHRIPDEKETIRGRRPGRTGNHH